MRGILGALALSKRAFSRDALGLGQFVYPVLFAYTFFEGYTTLLCIVTLFVVVQFSRRTDWNAVWQKKPRPYSC